MSLLLARIAAAHRNIVVPFNINTFIPGVEGAPGASWDMQVLSSMFTDTAGTIPATVGDSVALIKDQSGNGIDLLQSTVAAQPILSQDTNGYYYLQFNGTQYMLTGSSSSLNIHTFNLVSVVGMRQPPTTNSVVFYTKGAADLYPPVYRSWFSGKALLTWGNLTNSNTIAASIPASTPSVSASIIDQTGYSLILRTNGVQITTLSYTDTPTNYTTTTRFILGGQASVTAGLYNRLLIGPIYFMTIRILSSIDYTKLTTLEGDIMTHIGV